jgi:hypothetical protein
MWQGLMLVGPLASLMVNPWSNYDPISVVKMFVVVVFASVLLGLLFFNRENFWEKETKKLFITTVCFLICLISTLLFSGAPLDQQFWGYFGRNTGVLTYVAFIVILLTAANLRQIYYYHKLDLSLVWASIPMGAYCLLQIAGRDPINWSQFDVFGTLGNVNFLSGFLGLVSVSLFAKINAKWIGSLSIAYLLLLISYLAIIYRSNSIQGFVIFAVGSVIVLFVKFRTVKARKILQPSLVIVTFIMGYLSIQGLLNKGPIANLLYQPSNVLRADYMHAGWQMTTDHPFFGVGLDSYGDWYRQARGEITTLRGSADRNSNAAHSVFLDISSNGGFPLLVTYISILLVILRVSLKALKVRNGKYDPVLVSLFSVWISFHFQALISINQIGVAVWGWIIGGALFGYSNIVLSGDNVSNKLETKKLKAKLLPAKVGLSVFAFSALGFVLAAIPQQADSRYFTASKTSQIDLIEKAATSIGSTAWHRNLLIDNALAAQDSNRARKYANETISKYPRSFWPWKVIWILPDASESERGLALSKLKELDPFNPEFKSP